MDDDLFFLKEGTGLTEGSGMSALESSSPLRLGYPSYSLGSAAFQSRMGLQNSPTINKSLLQKRVFY